MPKKKEAPKHIEKHKRLRKKLRKLLDTHRLEHSKAYTTAADTLLKDAEGNIDYEKLEDTKIQDQFIDKMVDHYISKAKQTFKGIKPKDELEEDMLLRGYGTHTRGQLSQIIRNMGKKYTLTAHGKGGEKLIEKLTEELTPTVSAHLKKEHIDDIIKYTKSENVINKTVIDVPQAAGLLNIYEDVGAVTHELVKEHIGEEYVKKKSKEKPKE